jgi:hypothetical protein
VIEDLASAGAGVLLGAGGTLAAARLAAPALRQGDAGGFWRLQLALVPLKFTLVGAVLAALSRLDAFRPLPFALALAAGWIAAGTPTAVRQSRTLLAAGAACTPGAPPAGPVFRQDLGRI